MKSSSFSVRSKITAILMMSTIEKKNVPRNLPIMYRSRRFKGMYYLTIYNLIIYIRCMSRGVMSSFQALKSPARICWRASPTSQR